VLTSPATCLEHDGLSIRIPFASFAASLALAAATLHGTAHAQVAVADAWVRGTVAGQKASGAFMTLTASADARLVEVRSPIAGVIEIHEMAMDGAVMRMRAVDGVDLPGGKDVALAPGGFHVMLMDLRQPLKAGDTVALTLVIEGRDKSRRTVEVRAPVRALTTGPGPAAAPKR
jgi:copper(I)-binding protein